MKSLSTYLLYNIGFPIPYLPKRGFFLGGGGEGLQIANHDNIWPNINNRYIHSLLKKHIITKMTKFIPNTRFLKSWLIWVYFLYLHIYF